MSARCYQIILESVSKSPKPSFNDLKDKLTDAGFELSPRTLQRYLEYIRNKFGFDVRYNKAKNYYYLDEQQLPHVHTLLVLLGMLHETELFLEQSHVQNLKGLNVEDFFIPKGIQYIDTIQKAITQNKALTLVLAEGALRITPEKISNENGWLTLIGKEGNTPIAIKLCDIKSVSAANHLTKLQPETPKEIFTTVLIAVRHELADEVRMKPLHASQFEMKQKEKWVVFEYQLSNPEMLFQPLWLMKDRVKVLEPENLRAKLAETAKKVHKLNK